MTTKHLLFIHVLARLIIKNTELCGSFQKSTKGSAVFYFWKSFDLSYLCNHLRIIIDTEIQTLRLHSLLSASFSSKIEFSMYSKEPNLFIDLSEGRDTPFCISDTGWILEAAAPMQFPHPLFLSSLLAVLFFPVLVQALNYFVYGCKNPWLSCFPFLVHIYFQCF